MITEKRLRTIVRRALLSESELLAESLKAKAQALTAALNALTGDARSGVGKGGSDAHFRIRTDKTSTLSSAELQGFAKQIVDEVFGFEESTVANVGQVNSQMYDTYRVTDRASGQEVNILFTGTLAGGQRGGGYGYEDSVNAALAAAGASTGGPQGDTTQTDVFVTTAAGKPIGIEVKNKRGGKFGEPALHYDYGAKQWKLPARSKSKENAQLVADLLNQTQDPGLNAWLESLKAAWDADHPDAPMTEFGQISEEEYAALRAQGITQSGPKVAIDIQTIIDYYRKKGADYIQIETKGLYSFGDDPLGVGAPTFTAGMKGLQATVRPGIMTMSRGKKKIRATMEIPYLKGATSSLDLETPEGAQRFARALAGEPVAEAVDRAALRRLVREALESL